MDLKGIKSGIYYKHNNAVFIAIGLIIPLIISYFGSNFAMELFTLAYFILVLLICGLKSAVLLYVYLMFFSHILRSSGTTIVSYIGLLLSVCIVFRFFSKKQMVKYCLPFVVLLVYALRSVIISREFSGLSLIYSFVIAVLFKVCLTEKDYSFVKEFFFSIYLAALISSVCGFVTYLGLSSRFSIPIGIDSACMLLIGGMIFPIFFVKKNFIKTLSILFLLIPLMLTVSITALICLGVFCVFVVFYMLFVKNNGIALAQKKIIFTSVVLFIILFIIVWVNGCGIQAVDNIIVRAKTVVSQLQNGNYNQATTGRTEIYKLYIGYFNNFPVVKKLFGGGQLSYIGQAYYRNYSHNTLIDAIMFFGIIPACVLIMWFCRDLYKIKDNNIRYVVFLLKLVFGMTAMSVSLLSGGYWLLIMFI